MQEWPPYLGKRCILAFTFHDYRDISFCAASKLRNSRLYRTKKPSITSGIFEMSMAKVRNRVSLLRYFEIPAPILYFRGEKSQPHSLTADREEKSRKSLKH